MALLEKLKNPFTAIVVTTIFSLLPFVALIFDKLLLHLDYSVLFYIEIFAFFGFVGAGILVGYLFLKIK